MFRIKNHKILRTAISDSGWSELLSVLVTTESEWLLNKWHWISSKLTVKLGNLILKDIYWSGSAVDSLVLPHYYNGSLIIDGHLFQISTATFAYISLSVKLIYWVKVCLVTRDSGPVEGPKTCWGAVITESRLRKKAM